MAVVFELLLFRSDEQRMLRGTVSGVRILRIHSYADSVQYQAEVYSIMVNLFSLSSPHWLIPFIR